MTEFRKLNLETDVNKLLFNSGVEELNKFFFTSSMDYIKEAFCQVYYLQEEDTNQVLGYFAISCSDIEFKKELKIEKIIDFIPCVLIGRLAIDNNYQGKGYGTELLRIALNLSLSISETIGCRLVTVDARTDLAVINFYKKFNFQYFKRLEGSKIERALQSNHQPSSPTILMIFDLLLLKK